MSTAARDATYRLARVCLGAQSPADVAELDLVFGPLYGAIAKDLERLDERDTEEGGELPLGGLPFEASLAELAVVGVVVWYSACIVDAVRRMRQPSVPGLVRRLAHELARKTERLEDEIAREIEEVVASTLTIDARRSLIAEGPGADTPTLLLLVNERRRGAEVRLEMELLARQPGLPDRTARGAVTLQREPETYSRDLLGIVERLDGLLPADACERLLGIGATLFQEVLPEPIQDSLWELRGAARTVHVVTDEAWIPWELLVPCARETSLRGPHLGELFALARSAAAAPSGPCTLVLAEIALVAPEESGLKQTARERDIVSSLSREGPRVTQIPARIGAIREALASGRFDAFHFAGHASAHAQNPERWGLALDAGELLTAADLPASAARDSRRPFIFLNACAAGRGARTLSRLGGLAHAFRRAGAAAMVAPIWSIRDGAAADFAELFYSGALRDNLSIGEALRLARRGLRERYPGDATWLAYAAFAHPSTRLEGVLNPPRSAAPA